jgi:lysophospholipase L1-like esterase
MSLMIMQDKPIDVLFFGDSITELGVQKGGYIDLMNEKLAKNKLDSKFKFTGSGISGNKVYDLFFRLEKDVLYRKPDVVVIWIGVNDVWHKSSHGTGTDLPKFELMYIDIIDRLQSKGITVYCCTPACIGEKTDYSNAQDGDINEYSKTIRRIAASRKAGLIDIRSAFLKYNLTNNSANASQGILTNDGVHLNKTGNSLVADLMWENLVGK